MTLSIPGSRRWYADSTDRESTKKACRAVSPTSVTGASVPSGTTRSLTLPGRRSIPSWAISTITVAPSHRRRGIARNLLEAELRTAAALGVPVAILTVSEATIYSRFGFAPAALAADYRIDTTRAKWNGPTPGGRVQLVSTEQGRDGGGYDVVERARLHTPGQIHFEGHLWERMFGIPGRTDPNEIRCVRYDDEGGAQQGIAIYKAVHGEHGVSIEIQYFASATDDAYASLWRYFLELDLVTEVTAKLRSIDEPLKWQVTDARSVHEDHAGDHLWSRILDVKAALEARSYSAPAILTLEILDDLGFAAGGYRLEIDAGGSGTIAPVPEFVESPDLTMSINQLSAIYLGGVSVNTLVRAGRINAKTPAAATAADTAFRSEVTPWLSIWF
jgi:predicted acetyltransferase